MESSNEPDFFGMCNKCGEKVVGEGSGCTAMEMVYHIQCFTCTDCQKELRGKSFYALENNPFCEDCYLNTLEKCCVCEKPILDRILRATGKPYHPSCFTCVICRKSLDGIPFTVDATNQVHCIDCFHEKFAPRCSVCKEPIIPEQGKTETVRVVALDRSFHVACYKCEDCDLLLSSDSEGRGCYPLDDHILCRNCNAKRVQIVRHYSDKGITEFFPWQIEALEQPGVLENYSNLVYSAPTSAGKTMVSDVLLYKNILVRKKKAMIILPFVSITVEKVEALKKMLRRIGIKIGKFSGNSNPKGGFARVDVAVCTIEKANNMINRLIEEGNLSEVGLIVVDELHMLGDESRGYLLELLLTKVLYHSKKSKIAENLVQIVGMSATIPNLPDIARWLDAQLYVTDYRPVPLYERIVAVCGRNALATVQEYEPEKQDFKLLPSVDARDLAIDSDNDAFIYTAIETIVQGYSALIFCPTKAQCENFSREIAFNIYQFGGKRWKSGVTVTPRMNEIGEELVEKLKQNTDKVITLMDSLRKSPAGLDPQLEESLRFACAFHHAGMSTDEKTAIEEAFRKGIVKVLCSTTTLSAGVNLPARRVLISQPFDFRQRLLNVITYRQMIGRAGRMGIDDLGEAYTFCRMKDYDQTKELVKSEIKGIRSCLLRIKNTPQGSEDSNSSIQDCFQVVMSDSLKKAIIEIISNGTAATKSDVIEYCKCTFFNESFKDRLSPEEARTGSHFEPAVDQVFEYLAANKLIYFQNHSDTDNHEPRINISNLGKAIVASGIAPDDGQFVQKELDRARNNLCLVNDLHLIYQVTPIYVTAQLDGIDWRHYLELYQKFTPQEKDIGAKIGVSGGFLVSCNNSVINESNPRQFEKLQIHKRFYACLALNELIQEIPLIEVAKKYKMGKGQIQSLQQQAATFAGMLSTFCNKLGWHSLELLIEQFQPRLAFGVQRDLIDLMRITFLPATVARSLYRQYQTLKDIVYERAQDIEKVIFQGIAFDNKQVIDPNARMIFVPGLEQHFSVSDLAKKILHEAREIIQAEFGHAIDFEPSQKGVSGTDIRISPIKDKPELKPIVDIDLPLNSSTPIIHRNNDINDKNTVKKNEKNASANDTYDHLFDDDLDFSFGATPNKQKRLEKTASETPTPINYKRQRTSSMKISFEELVTEPGPSNQTDNAKSSLESIPEANAKNVPGSSCTIHTKSSTTNTKEKSIPSEIVDDYGALLEDNGSLYDLTWSEMIDEVNNRVKDKHNDMKNSCGETVEHCFIVPSAPSCCSTLKFCAKDAASQQHFDRLLDEISTNDSLPVHHSRRMDPSLASQDSGAPKTSNDTPDSESYDLDDSEDYSNLFSETVADQKNEADESIASKESSNKLPDKKEQTEPQEKSEQLYECTSSFEFDDEFSQEEIEQMINRSQIASNITISESIITNDDEDSSSWMNFFETFKKNCNKTVPQNFVRAEAIRLDKLELIDVVSEHRLEEMIDFIEDQSLDLVIHFVTKSYSEPEPIVQRPKSQKTSIAKLLQPKVPQGLIIRIGNAVELVELFVTIIGEDSVYRINTKEIFELFIDKFRALLAKIEPQAFGQANQSPFSEKSDVSDAPKSIRILTYDVKMCVHLFSKAFKLPLRSLIRRIEWFDLQVAIWLLNPMAPDFCIRTLTIQDLVQLTLDHSLSQSFIQRVRLLQISFSGGSKTPVKSRYRTRVLADDCPQIGMFKTIVLPCLMNLFCRKLVDENLYRSYQIIEIPARLSFATMEMKGVRFNDIALNYENKRLRRFRNYLAKRIFAIVGQEFNLNSPEQVAKVLFQDQGLLSDYFNVTKAAALACTTSLSTKKIRVPKLNSTDKAAMMKLQKACGTKTNLPTLIMEWRKLNHSLESCIHPIRFAMHDGGIVYCQLKEWTATGRVAMHEPNLINVDKDYEITSISSEIGKRLLDADGSDDEDCSFTNDRLLSSPTKGFLPASSLASSFTSSLSKYSVSRPVKIRLRKTIIARDGYCLVSADYRQLELRILAHFSKDDSLLKTLNDSSIDVFTAIAAHCQMVPTENVTYEQRQQAKQICYGIIYGMGDKRLAEALAVSKEEAIQFRVSFLQKYCRIQDFIDETLDECKKNGFVEMLSHRRRLLPNINSDDSAECARAQRQAINSVIQGSAADCVKMAMLAVDSAIRRSLFDACLVLQMHDELMYEVRDDDTVPESLCPKEFARLLKTQMEDVSRHLQVNLTVKVQCGPCWGELEEITDL